MQAARASEGSALHKERKERGEVQALREVAGHKGGMQMRLVFVDEYRRPNRGCQSKTTKEGEVAAA